MFSYCESSRCLLIIGKAPVYFMRFHEPFVRGPNTTLVMDEHLTFAKSIKD
jgi:hypothetical protein